MGNTHDTQIARIEADFIGSRWKTVDDYRWGYCKDRGPETWWVYYPSASGGNQSPIDILTEDVYTNPELSAHPLQINYVTSGAGNKDGGTSGGTAGSGSSSGVKQTSGLNVQTQQQQQQQQQQNIANGSAPREKMKVVNNGNASSIRISHSRSTITGGPLKEYSYVLDRIELHWGENDNNGSEHLVNSRPFSAEVQLIHWNEDLYDSYDEATKRDDGIAIIAVFAKLTDSDGNKTLQTWSSIIEDIGYRGSCVPVKEEFEVKKLLPDDTAKYWCYRGSYTTPPCYETVTWIVMSQNINITSEILKQFRGLKSYCDTDVRPDDEYDGMIQKNCRPVQPLGTRKISSPEIEIIRRRPKSYEGMLQEQTTVRVSIFPELFDPQRREELFKWLQ